MQSEKRDLLLPISDPGKTSARPPRTLTPTWAARAVLTTLLLVLAVLQLPARLLPSLLPGGAPSRVIHWKPCGTGLQCTTISAPLNHHNASDPRTVQLAVAKYPADKSKKRAGTIFVNPGGPGGTGTGYVHQAGEKLSKVSGGQYVSTRARRSGCMRVSGVRRRS